MSFGQVAWPTADLPSLPLRNKRVTLVGTLGRRGRRPRTGGCSSSASTSLGSIAMDVDTELIAVTRHRGLGAPPEAPQGEGRGAEPGDVADLETAPYPRFGDDEMAPPPRGARGRDCRARRRAHAALRREPCGLGGRLADALARHARGAVVVTPGEADLLLVNFYNHVPNAQRLATEAEVRWAGDRPMATAIEEPGACAAPGDRIGLIGPLGYRAHRALRRASRAACGPARRRVHAPAAGEVRRGAGVAAGGAALTDAASRA